MSELPSVRFVDNNSSKTQSPNNFFAAAQDAEQFLFGAEFRFVNECFDEPCLQL